jgi:hypothetical protein
MTSTQTFPSNQFPTTLRRAQYAVFVVAAIHVVALLLILWHRDVIAASVAAHHPELTGAALDKLSSSTVMQSVIPHVVLAVLLPLRAWRLRRGRRWTQLFLTVLLAIQVAAHATLPIVLAELPGYGAAVVAVQAVSLVFEVAALGLLWTREARRYFASQAPSAVTAPAAS